jgi:hypothetical protein
MKYQTFVAVGDNHGDKCDPIAFEGFKQFLKEFKPQHRVHLGDCFDFRSLRRGVSSNDNESHESLYEDVESGIEFIEAMKPTVFLYGNHEDRLAQLYNNSSSGVVRDYANDLDQKIKSNLKTLGCKKIYPYHADLGVHRIGPISFVHGYTCNRYAIEEHATHYGTAGGAVIMGHIHRIGSANAKKHGGVVGFSGGCMCLKKEMEYAKNRLATSQWGLGWTYGVIEGNEWKVWQAHRFNDGWIWTTEIKTWQHKTK